MHRQESAVAYRESLRDQLRAALTDVRLTDYTLIELQELLAIIQPAQRRVACKLRERVRR